jgi:hypothetical protein
MEKSPMQEPKNQIQISKEILDMLKTCAKELGLLLTQEFNALILSLEAEIPLKSTINVPEESNKVLLDGIEIIKNTRATGRIMNLEIIDPENSVAAFYENHKNIHDSIKAMENAARLQQQRGGLD